MNGFAKNLWRRFLACALAVGPAMVAADEWELVGGYILDGRARVCLRGESGTTWLIEGQRFAGGQVVQIDSGLQWVLLENDSGERLRVGLASPAASGLPIVRAPFSMAEVGITGESEARKHLLELGLNESQVEALLNHAGSATQVSAEIFAEELLQSAGKMDEAAIRRIQAKLSQIGTLVMWSEGPDGAPVDIKLVAWPMVPRESADGSMDFAPADQEAAERKFREFIEAYPHLPGPPQTIPADVPPGDERPPAPHPG